MTAKRLARANLILDNACKQAGLDPVAVRLAMINTIKAKLDNEGKGYSRMPPTTPHCKPEMKDDAIKVLESGQ